MSDKGSFTPEETAVPVMSKEDYMLLLLEQLVRLEQDKEGRIPRVMAWEGDLLTLTSTFVEADFPHDAWVVYFRAEANAALRIWPGGTPPSSGAIELRDGCAVRIKSTSNTLHLTNTGAATCHWFAIALSVAEVEFYDL